MTEPEIITEPVPESVAKLASGKLNAQHLFSLYATLGADPVKTAHAVGVRVEDIEAAATKGKWNSKLAALTKLKQSAAPDAIERAISRAISFSMGHRLRVQVERCIQKLENLTDEELEDHLCTTEISKTGTITNKFNTRFFADLASAAEKAAAVCAQALQDTAQDRARREESSGGNNGESAGSIHSSIAKAMAEIAADNSPTNLLLEAQVAQADALAAKVKVIPG